MRFSSSGRPSAERCFGLIDDFHLLSPTDDKSFGQAAPAALAPDILLAANCRPILHLRTISLRRGSRIRIVARQILPCDAKTFHPSTPEATMRLFILGALAITAFATTMTFSPSDANALVCARGVVRAGCAGPHGAAVVGPRGAAAVRAPVAACRVVVVNGVRVRRCA
jgi:hypothetical protein